MITLHRWSFLPEIEKGDNVVILIAENLTELAPKLVSNPKVATIVGADAGSRDETGRRARSRTRSSRRPRTRRYAEMTAGLKAIQIASIVTPPPPAEDDAAIARAVHREPARCGSDAARARTSSPRSRRA